MAWGQVTGNALTITQAMMATTAMSISGLARRGGVKIGGGNIGLLYRIVSFQCRTTPAIMKPLVAIYERRMANRTAATLSASR